MELIGLVAILIATFYLLAVVCDEFFVESLEIISERLKLSPDVAGATFMAVGSSAPELFTSLLAVFRTGSQGVGSGTIVGSAIFNILVIIGASALFRTAKLNWQPVVRDTLFYAVSIVILLVAFWDGRIVLAEALVFVAMYVVYLVAVVNWRKWFPYTEDKSVFEVLDQAVVNVPMQSGLSHQTRSERDDNFALVSLAKLSSSIEVGSRKILGIIIPDAKKDPDKFVWTFVASIGLIAVLSHVLVEAAVHLGEIIHVPAVIISLTVLAAGTSIPDLLSSMIVAKKGRGDMAISNAVGSNIFDILFGLGVPWVLVLLWREMQGVGEGFVPVATENLKGSVFLLFATLLATFVMIALRNWKIGPKAGWLLIITYLCYLGYTILSVMGVVNLTPL